jgi:hypothetical protein
MIVMEIFRLTGPSPGICKLRRRYSKTIYRLLKYSQIPYIKKKIKKLFIESKNLKKLTIIVHVSKKIYLTLFFTKMFLSLRSNKALSMALRPTQEKGVPVIVNLSAVPGNGATISDFKDNYNYKSKNCHLSGNMFKTLC